MNKTNCATVVGVFSNRQQAQRAVEDLRNAGFREDQIGVITQGTESDLTVDRETGSKLGEGAAIGAATGAGVGLLWGLGVAAQLFPPLGIVAGGTLLALLASAGTGATISAVIGALIGLGVPEDEAGYYEDEVKNGRTLVTVQAEGRSDPAWNIMTRHGAYNAATAGTARCGTAAGAEGKTIQVHEEQLHAHKKPVQTGEVRVRKEVHTEHQTLDVPVQREEVIIERRPAAGQQASVTDLRPGEEIRIPVKEEQVHVEKQLVTKEEVSVGKRTIQDKKTVAGDVRKEEVKVEQEGQVNIRDTGNRGPAR
jgi:uncharacterized protein (TIGR02271 family)